MDLLTIIAVIILALWLLGIVSNITLGGLIHVLLVIAIVVVLINSRTQIQRRKPM
jgi:hypothetical protein